MTRIVGSLFGHPSSAPGWRGEQESQGYSELSEGWGSDGACFRTAHGIITACHLVTSNTWCYVNDRAADAIARWPDDDVALVRCDEPELQELELSPHLPRLNDRVTWYGLDDSWRQEQAEVIVTSVTEDRIELSWAPSRMGPGDSGAPVLDARGQVIGMMRAEVRYRAGSASVWRAVMVPSTVILRLVATAGRLFSA